MVVSFAVCRFGCPDGVGVPEFFVSRVVVSGDDVCLFVCGAGDFVLVACVGAFARAAVAVAAGVAVGSVSGASLFAAGRVLCGGFCDDGCGAGAVAGVDGECAVRVDGVCSVCGGGVFVEVGFRACGGEERCAGGVSGRGAVFAGYDGVPPFSMPGWFVMYGVAMRSLAPPNDDAQEV